MSPNDASPRRRGRCDTDETLIAALSAGRTYEDAANLAGVSRSTVNRRLADAGFRGRLESRRTELLDLTVRSLGGAALRAVGVLREVAEDRTSPVAARVTASRSPLTIAPIWGEQADLIDRLTHIESVLLAERDKTS
jgi:hypothetical protein